MDQAEPSTWVSLGWTVANNVFVGNRTDGSDYKIQLDLAGTATGELTGDH